MKGKIVCVGTVLKNGEQVSFIKKGKVYNSFGQCMCGSCGPDKLKLEEIPNYSFSSYLFAPLQDNFAEEVLTKASEEHKKMKPKIKELT